MAGGSEQIFFVEMKEIKKLVRKEVFNFQSYIPGKPIAELLREIKNKKVNIRNIVKLASNENPLGPSKKVLTSLKKNLKNIYFYPQSSCPELRKKLAQKLKVKPKNLIFGNGSDEIIELIGKTFLNPEDEIIVSEHAFIRYKMAGDLMGCKVVTIPMKDFTPLEISRRDTPFLTGFTHDLEGMAKAVTPKTKAIFIANPNNPTGTYNTASELADFFERLEISGQEPLVMVDEAYYEYARVERDYPETIPYLEKYPNLVILRTFSKIYGLAGLRIGYGIARKEIIDFLERIRPPFNVNSLAQEAALASLNDGTQLRKSVQLVKEGKKYLYQELKKAGLSYVPSAANFILVKVNGSGQKVFNELLSYGVIIRPMEEYGFPEHIRVTIGLPEENRRFIQALRNYLQ